MHSFYLFFFLDWVSFSVGEEGDGGGGISRRVPIGCPGERQGGTRTQFQAALTSRTNTWERGSNGFRGPE